jgi:MFS family permease
MNSLGLSMNFGLANTIVQERAPDYLRGRVSAVFGLSFFGLMPIAGLVITSVSDLIGMRNALMIGSIIYGLIGLFVLARVRRQCSEPIVGEMESTEAAPPPVAATIYRDRVFHVLEFSSTHRWRRDAARDCRSWFRSR